MRALILVAGAALAVSACSSNESADNTMNVDTIEAENLVTNDTTAIDATTNMDANMATDMNMDMNATDANVDANAANTTNAM
jgi:hypothetical protein